MKSHSKRILSLVFALLMLFQQVMFAAQTVDLFNPELGAKTVDLIPGEDDTNTVDLLTPSDEDSTKTVDLLNPEQPSATIEQQKPIIEKNENKTVDTITPRGDDIVPAEGKKSTTTIVVGGDEIEEGETNENSEISPEEIILPEENEKEEKKDASFEDEEHHENAGVLPWSTDLVKPWSIYRAPKTVYRPGEDLDLTELLVEIKTGRSGCLYNIEDLINDEFTTITRTRKSDGQKVRLDDKIYEDETMTIHMDGCQDLTIDFTVDENLKDEAKAFEAFQQNLIREEFRNGLDFSLYLIKKGEKENPVVAYSLDPHKLTPIGNGVDKKLKDGPLFDLKDINTWDRYDVETIGKVKAILERSAETKETENIRKKLITQLAIWNVTSNIIPEEIDATVSEPTEIAPELKPAEETKENPEEDKKDEPIEITEPTTPEEETENIEKENEKVEDTKDETVEIKTEEKVEEKIEAEESEKIEEKAPVQSTVHKIVFNAKEIDVPYDDIELSDEEYELYKELTSLEAVELKNEDEDLKIYEPIIIEETENQYADLVTIGEGDIDSIERVATEVTFDAVEYSFQNLYHTLETSSMLGFGQPRDFNVLLKATMKASRKIVKGDKFEVEILSKTLPILDGEEGRANDIQIDGKVVATAEYIAEEHKIVYTFVEDLDTDKVEIEQEFKQIKEEKAALLNMLDVSENLVLDAVRGAEGDENSEENPDELEISPEFEENLIELKLGNTPVQYNGVSFETKKFRLKTTMTAKAFPIWQIPKYWTFDVKIGDYLKPDPNYPLKNLYDPDNPSVVIAKPTYNPNTHTITYTYEKSISSTKTLVIDQYLAFDTVNIGDKEKIDINISVEPKNNPKQQMPTKTVYRDDRSSVITSAFEVEFDENGEPNLNNQYKFFEYGPSYKVTFDAKSTPIVEDRKMVAIDWEITFDGNGRKLGEEDLKLITNFTAVENSGIKNINDVKLNGQPLTNLEPNFSNEFLINDSKNVVGKHSSDKYIFTFRTPVERQQQAYILDIAAKLGKVNRTGAVRLIQPYIDGVDLAYESPTVLKYSNRVTNKGEFLSEDQIRWTLTEEVSSGDDGILPLVTRALSDNQTIASFKVAHYILNGDGKMAKVGETKNITSKEIEQGKLDGDKKFAPGTIAVYEIITNIDSKDDHQGNVYSFGDNRISLYRNVDVNIKWSVQEAGKDNLPEETLTLTSEDEKHTTSKTIKPEENEKINPAGKNVQIENVKRWEFVNGKLEEIKYNLTQKLPNDEEVNDGTIYYKELTNSFNIYDKRYEILNTIFKGKDVKTANIKIIKKDSKNNKLLLPGARFSLIGDGSSNMEYSGVTDYNGEVVFKNVTPGVYILQEDSAPGGYKRHNTTDTVTVDENGRVTWTNNIIATENYKTSLENKDGKLSTDVLYRNGSPIEYPSYMNALSYATIDGKNFKYYVFLKPDYNTTGTRGTANGTDQITRFFISYTNVTGKSKLPKNIKIYSVPAKNKSTIKKDFLNKDIEKHLSGFEIVNMTDKITDKNIELHTNAKEDYLGKYGYQIDFPTQKFKDDYGIIVCYSGQIDDEQLETIFCYDWIRRDLKTDTNRILDARTIIPGVNDRVKNSNNEARNPILVVNNTQKKRFPIIVNTKDDKRIIVGGAEFTLTEKNSNRTVEVQTTDSNGRCEFRDIPEGEYLLKETKSPTGLSKYNLTFNVTITPGGQVLYSAVDENGNEVDPGDKYTIGTVEVDDNNPSVGTKTIKVLSHSMTLNETSGWGTRRGVWEEAKYEAYDFKASFMLNYTEPGDKIVIDFDDNWNMTQWSGDMPNIVTKDGQIVARPQLDTEKNILTYTLTDYVKGKTNINASLLIQSIRPSKYYVKVDKNDDGSPIIYKFLDTITTLPGAAEQSKVEQVTYVEPDLGPYFGTKGDREPLYITQNVDITTKNSGNREYLELRNVTVFNPEGKKNVTGDRQLKIFYGMTTDPNVTEMGNKIEPPYKPTRVVVYKVDNPNKYNLPVTGGIKPSEDSNTYKQIANFNIVYNTTKVETQNGVTLNYNENRVNISRNIVPTLNNNTNVQFMITLPPTSKGEGYVVEQFYDVTDEDTFRDNYSMTSVYYTGAWGRSGGISQMKPKKNSGTANSGKVVDVPEINHDLTVYHYKSIGNFIVKKTDEKGKALRGAKFTLTDGKGIVVDEVTVGEDGIGKFNNIPSGKYVIEETKAPDGYKATDRTIDVTVGDNGVISFDGVENDDKVFKLIDSKNPTMQVTNKPIKTKVTIVKVDEDNPEQKLSGAVFKLFDENGKEVKRDDKPYTVTTGKDGKATFKDLEPGKTYIIRELEAPKGYEKTNKFWKVVVGEDKTVKISQNEIKQFFDISRPKYDWIYNYSDTNLFGDGNPRNVLDVYPIIEDKNDGTYSVKVNFAGLNSSDFSSSFKLDFDNEHFKFYDNDINKKGTYEENVKFNSGRGLLEFRFKPKSILNKGEYTPLKNVRYVDFDMDKSFLPKLTKTNEQELTTPKTVDKKEFSFEISNKFKGFEVEFTKIGRDTNGDVFLSGAVFELKIKNGESYKDPVEGKKTTATSDTNGKVRFFNLKPGSYQIFETLTPDGYKKPEGPVKEFIIEEDGTIKVKTKDGYKTFENDDQIFNIINLKPGDGKFKIIKTDGQGNKLPGIEFELYNSAGKVTINGKSKFTTDGNGEISFENLPYDKYYVKEVSTKPGYILDDREKVVIIGNQWKINPNAKGKDVSDLLELDKAQSKMKTYKGLKRNGKKLLTPNTADVIIADLAYKVKLGGKINEGDTFTIYAGDNVDVDGIGLSKNEEYDLYGPAGLLAKAEIDKSRNKVHYTFTEYAKHYNITDINLQVLLAANRHKVRGGITQDNEGFEEITVNISNTNIDPKNIDPSKVLSDNFDVQYEYGKYPDGSPFDINACLVRFYEQDKTFDVYYYINNRTDGHQKTYSRNKRLKFTSNAKIAINSIDTFKLTSGTALPWSFGFNLNRNSNGQFAEDIRKYGLSYISDFYKYDQYGNYYAYLNYNGADDATYLVKVSGKVTDNTVSNFRLTCEYTNQFWNGNSYENGYKDFSVFKKLEFGKSKGNGIIEVSVPNFKNKIEYTKVDGSIAGTAGDTKTQGAAEGSNEPIKTPKPVFSSSGNPLSGVSFQLQKKNASGEFENYGDSIKSDTNGKFSWEGLPKGEYQVIEIEAKPGYQTPKEEVSSFTVNDKGEIVDIKDNTTIIINEKIKPDIEFLKVDGNDKAVKLSGAEFTLYKAEKVENANNELKFGMVNKNFEFVQEEKEAYKVISGDNGKLDEGKFKFEGLEDGIYAVKETKAPKDYALLTKYAFFFKVEGGKIYRVDELGKYIDSNKKDVEDKDKDTDSLIVDITLDKPINNVTKIENFKAEYPSTGGVGALPFVFIGMMIMMVGAYMFIRRRDALYE